MGAKEEESSSGCVWAAGFHHVTACSHLAHVLKLNEPFISSIFKFFSGCSKLPISEAADTELVDTEARLYVQTVLSELRI
jgi:hypothetical protein